MTWKVCAVALVCALMGALLEGLGFKAKKLLVTLSLIMLMLGLLSHLGELFGSLGELAYKVGVGDAVDKALRAMGLGYVFGFTSDICASLGESTLASLVLTVGRVEIFMLALPYFLKTVELGMELLS